MRKRIRRTVPRLTVMSLGFLFSFCSVRPPAEPDLSIPDRSRETGPAPQVNARALEHFMDGEMLMMQGNYAMAILEFQDALTYDSSAPTILTSIGEAYMKIGKPGRAESHLKEALSYDAKNREAREMLGQHYYLRGQVTQAEEQYRLLREFYPETREYRYILAEITSRKGNPQGAQEQFWEIYTEDTLETRALLRAAEIAKDRKDFPFALQAYELLINHKPQNMEVLRSYSELAILLRDFHKAVLGLEKLTKLADDDAQIRERLAIVHFNVNDTVKADSILKGLYDENHRSPSVFYYLITLAMERGEYDQAERYSSEYLEKYPKEQTAYTNLATAYLNLGKTLDAISVLLKAREHFPDSFSVNFLLGDSYSREENYILARETLLLVLKTAPNSQMQRLAKHLLASVYNHLQEWESSDQLYQELIETKQDDSRALNNYGYTLAERGIDLDYALEIAQKAIALEPENAAYLDTIGWIYYKLGDYQGALENIKKSIDIEQDNAVVLEHLGDVLVKLQKKKEALDYYKKALELDLDNDRLRHKITE